MARFPPQIPTHVIRFNLSLTETVRVEAKALLRRMGLSDQARIVAVVPGARWETKVWLPERFAETIDGLHADGDSRCLLLGGPSEVSLCEEIARACRSEPISLAGRTSLRQLAAVVGLADVVLCHDSAAMHLAVALERPLVCLIGDVVRLKLDCAPCYLRRLSRCRYGHRCMKDLDTGIVVDAVRRALEACPLRA